MEISTQQTFSVLTDESEQFLDFLHRYWTITTTHVERQCGSLWDSHLDWHQYAEVYLFGTINDFGRQSHLTIDQTLSLCAVFLVEKMDKSLTEAQQTLDHIIAHVEAWDCCAYSHAGEQALKAFAKGDFTSTHRLADLLMDDLASLPIAV